MLGRAPAADAAGGDLRLLFTMIGDKPVAMLYRYRLGKRPPAPVVVRSPAGEETIDEIVPVKSARVNLVQAPRGWSVEAAVPWADLGFLTADPNGVSTVGRHDWANKSLAALSDLPSEARVHPNLWGDLRFEAPSIDSLLDP